jgi:dolichol phosphate-mannose biosynthesis regulatory protein
MVEARACGKIYLAVIVVFWVYYSVWILVTPLIDADHRVQSFFASRESGLLLTTVGAYGSMSYLCTFVGIVLIRDKYQTKRALEQTQNELTAAE